jgi:hypothetical protein
LVAIDRNLISINERPAQACTPCQRPRLLTARQLHCCRAGETLLTTQGLKPRVQAGIAFGAQQFTAGSSQAGGVRLVGLLEDVKCQTRPYSWCHTPHTHERAHAYNSIAPTFRVYLDFLLLMCPIGACRHAHAHDAATLTELVCLSFPWHCFKRAARKRQWALGRTEKCLAGRPAGRTDRQTALQTKTPLGTAASHTRFPLALWQRQQSEQEGPCCLRLRQHCPSAREWGIIIMERAFSGPNKACCRRCIQCIVRLVPPAGSVRLPPRRQPLTL